MTINYKIIVSLFIITGILATFSSCVREYDPGFDEHVSSLTLNAVITPDTSISFRLDLSRSTVDSIDFEPVRGVVIDLYEDGQKIETINERVRLDSFLVFDQNTGEERWENYESVSYQSESITQAGKNYRIEARKPGFEIITAETTIPNTMISILPITDEVRISEIDYGGGVETYIDGNFYVDIDDPANDENFYEFALYVLFMDSVYDYDLDNQEVIFVGLQEARRRVYATISNGNSNNTSTEFGLDAPLEQFSDVRFNGETTRFVFRDLYRRIPPHVEDYGLELEVRFLSEEYYNYFTSYAKYAYNEGNFLAEPVIVFNNIENGFGVFAGYQSVVFPIEF